MATTKMELLRRAIGSCGQSAAPKQGTSARDLKGAMDGVQEMERPMAAMGRAMGLQCSVPSQLSSISCCDSTGQSEVQTRGKLEGSGSQNTCVIAETL